MKESLTKKIFYDIIKPKVKMKNKEKEFENFKKFKMKGK